MNVDLLQVPHTAGVPPISTLEKGTTLLLLQLTSTGVPRITGGQERLNRLLPTLGRSVALTILVREYREWGPAWRHLSLTGLLPADNLNRSQRSLLNYGLTGFECHPALSGLREF